MRYDSADWFGPYDRGGPILGAPAVVAWGGERRLDFALYRANNVVSWTYWRPDANGWGPWTDLPVWANSAPAISSWGPGRLDVFFRSFDNNLYHTGSNRYESSTWHGPYNRGGTLTTGPGAVAGQW